MKSLRILTTVHFANPGACLFTEALNRNLSDHLPDYEVRVLDYTPRNWLYYEFMRVFKPHPGAVLFNLKRHLTSEKFHRQYLNLERPTPFFPIGYKGMTNFLSNQHYDALVVGMVVWDITNLPQIPRFPNIYWLSDEIKAKKIAYAASGHRSQTNLVKENLPAIQRILSSYSLIGVRDQITLEMVLESKADQYVPVLRVPDPVFMHDIRKTKIEEILIAHGIDPKKPITGLLFFGKPDLSQELCNFYRSKGFQILSTSVYNPFADVNLGHILSPHEWADSFNYFSFCVTDRLHGTAFCLKANIPFICIEPYPPKTTKNSKILSLVDDFELRECYMDATRENFRIDEFLSRAEELRDSWSQEFKPKISSQLGNMRQRSLEFNQMIREIL